MPVEHEPARCSRRGTDSATSRNCVATTAAASARLNSIVARFVGDRCGKLIEWVYDWRKDSKVDGCHIYTQDVRVFLLVLTCELSTFRRPCHPTSAMRPTIPRVQLWYRRLQNYQTQHLATMGIACEAQSFLSFCAVLCGMLHLLGMIPPRGRTSESHRPEPRALIHAASPTRYDSNDLDLQISDI